MNNINYHCHKNNKNWSLINHPDSYHKYQQVHGHFIFQLSWYLSWCEIGDFFAYSFRSQLYQGIGWKMLYTYGLLFSIFFNQLSNLIKDSEWSMPFVILMIFIGFQVNFFSFFLFVSPFIHSYYLLQISFGRKKKRKEFQLYTNNELVVIIIIVVQIDCWTFWLLAPDVLLSFFFALSAWPHTHLLSSFSLLWLVLVYSKKMLIMNMNKRNGGKNHDYFGGPLLYFKYKPVFCFFSYLFF